MPRSSTACTRELRITDQLSFYQSRVEEYRKAHRQTVIVRNALLLAAAVAAAVGQFTTGTDRSAWAVAATILAAVAGAVTAFEAVIGFPQLQKLYSDAARNLEEAAIDWKVANPHEDLTAEVERVEGIFRSEIGQWGQLVVKAAAPPTPRAATGGDVPSEKPPPDRHG